MTPATTLRTDYVLQDADLLLDATNEQYILKVRDLPIEQKPREKLIATGPHELNVTELMAILLGVGTRKEEVMAMSKRLLKEYGERAIIHETDPQRLSESLDIPLSKACQIVACVELGRRFFDTKAGKSVYVRTADQAYEYLSDMSHLQKEHLRGLYLNSRHQVVHDEVISIGSLTANIVHPREVFQPAIAHGAVAVIIAHNHPSGSLDATSADMDVTSQLKAAGSIIGIDLLDHLIIAADSYISIINS